MPDLALAYVFWHSPAPDGDLDAYAAALVRWHAALAERGAVIASATWHLPAGAPWRASSDGPAFEDWYVVADWTALGRLEHDAVSPALLADHDAAAARAMNGVAGVWRGPAQLPGDELQWTDVAPAEGQLAWRRCLTLGPAPQYAVSGTSGSARFRL